MSGKKEFVDELGHRSIVHDVKDMAWTCDLCDKRFEGKTQLLEHAIDTPREMNYHSH